MQKNFPQGHTDVRIKQRHGLLVTVTASALWICETPYPPSCLWNRFVPRTSAGHIRRPHLAFPSGVAPESPLVRFLASHMWCIQPSMCFGLYGTEIFAVLVHDLSFLHVLTKTTKAPRTSGELFVSAVPQTYHLVFLPPSPGLQNS